MARTHGRERRRLKAQNRGNKFPVTLRITGTSVANRGTGRNTP